MKNIARYNFFHKFRVCFGVNYFTRSIIFYDCYWRKMLGNG